MKIHNIPFVIKSVLVEVVDTNNKRYSFTHDAVNNEWDIVGQVVVNPDIEKFVMYCKNVNELCEILKKSTINIVESYDNCVVEDVLYRFRETKDFFPGYDMWEEHIKHTNSLKEIFDNEVKSNITELSQIKNIVITAYCGEDIEEDNGEVPLELQRVYLKPEVKQYVIEIPFNN